MQRGCSDGDGYRGGGGDRFGSPPGARGTPHTSVTVWAQTRTSKGDGPTWRKTETDTNWSGSRQAGDGDTAYFVGTRFQAGVCNSLCCERSWALSSETSQ